MFVPVTYTLTKSLSTINGHMYRDNKYVTRMRLFLWVFGIITTHVFLKSNMPESKYKK